MGKIFMIFLIAIFKNNCQISFRRKFSTKNSTSDIHRHEILTRDIPLLEIQKEIFSEDAILNPSRVLNAEFSGTLPQQVLIRTFSRYTSSDCTGTMLTESIAITAAHCVEDRGSHKDVLVYPPEKNCGRLSLSAGIEACKVVEKLEGNICQEDGHDIALVKLSRPMPGMRSLKLNFNRIRTGKQTIMAGTGVNFNQTCESQISYQTMVDCSRVSCYGRQWYCTEGSYKETSGACTGDSGGPSWAFGLGLTGLTAAATVDDENDPCTNGYSIFTNLNYYKSWVEETMRNMKTCIPIDVDHRNIPNNPNPIINGFLGFIGGAVRFVQWN